MKRLNVLSVLFVLVIVLSSCANNVNPTATSTTEGEIVSEAVLTEEMVMLSETATAEPTTVVTTTRVLETDKIENVTTKEYSTNWWGKVNKAKFEVESDIRYSADGGSSYGNQRKEFPSDKECYVRIASKVTSNGAGKDDLVYVTYRFTGTDKYSVKLSEGMVRRIQGEENTIVYIQEIVADKEKNAEENIVVFQITPFGEGSATVNVLYGDNVDARYDKSSAIYFRSETE